MTVPEFPNFDILDPKVVNGTVVEASAGTGKTFSVAAFVTRAIALNDDLRIGNVLVTTFTRNAAAELRDRLRRRLVRTERQLRSDQYEPNDDLAVYLGGADRIRRADNLARAVREFDTATISTIHSVCSRILAMAGYPTAGEVGESDIARMVAEVVNDAVVVEAGNGFRFNPGRLAKVVRAKLAEPLSVLDYKPCARGSDGRTKEELNEELDRLVTVVEECVDRVNTRTQMTPTFDDMIRRTNTLLHERAQAPLVAALRQRFTLAIIDEAQDTDHQQWSIFTKIFDADSTTHTLLAVGDPKQAIYRFRGADVNAYLSVRQDDKRLTLRQNWRSDSQLISVLNALFKGWTFGPMIDYVPVVAQPAAPATSITGTKPLTIIDIGATNSNPRVIKPAARRVREILATVKIVGKDGPSIRPRDICVLVNTKAIGASIEAELRSMGISAVSSGTENVMEGEIAGAFARLFAAMLHPYDTSLVRLAAASPFFGHALSSAGSLDDEALEQIQRTVIDWASVLRRRGVSALAAQLRSDPAIVVRMVRGDEGERRETDFAHVVELLHAATGGAGCTASDALEAFADLSAREATSETVSRRIESDRDAVQIMTVHASKGLEFPIVVVADLWKKRKKERGPDVFHRTIAGEQDAQERVIDVGYVVTQKYPEAAAARIEEEGDEVSRLLYVALTRAKHHVSLIVGDKNPKRDDGPRATTGLNDPARYASVSNLVDVVPREAIGVYPQYMSGGGDVKGMTIAPINGSTTQTYQRHSFSSIAKKREGRQESQTNLEERSGAGHNDDDEEIISIRSGYASTDVEFGVSSMPLARVPGGTYFGKVMHAVYERVDFAAADLREEVSRVVDTTVGGALLRNHRDEIIDGVVLSLTTPMGGPLGQATLTSITASNRLNEMSFEMGLAGIDDKVTVSVIGEVLADALSRSGRADDILMPYARELASDAFRIPMFGLMNGSIDTLIRVTGGGVPRLYVTDWKSNRLDEDGADTLIECYDREAMMREMEHHHYPLQALIYGVSVHRYVRSRIAEPRFRPSVEGLAYFFIRAMVGEDTPFDDDANRHGVFVWTAPEGLWDRLSDAMSGVGV